MLTKEEIARAQTGLALRYYNLGEVDGVVGPKTLAAVRAFEFEHNLRSHDAAPPREILPGTLKAIEEAPVWARGIDVARYQDGTKKPVADLAAVRASGVSFCVVKTGGADGEFYQDPEARVYYPEARKVGLIRGAYYFHTFAVDPEALAGHFYLVTRALGGLQAGDLPPALDVEDYKTRIRGQDAVNHVMACLKKVEALFGVQPLLYTSASVLRTHYADFSQSPLGQYKLWVPAYGVNAPDRRVPACHSGRWAIWQTGYDDGLPGVSNDVDRDFFQGTEQELRAITVRG